MWQRYTKSCVQCINHNAWVHHTLHTTFRVSPSHYGFVQCKIILHSELPQRCMSELYASCLRTGISRLTIPFNLKFLVYPATKNLVLPLIWFHSVHLWPRTNLGKLTFETTLVVKNQCLQKKHREYGWKTSEKEALQVKKKLPALPRSARTLATITRVGEAILVNSTFSAHMRVKNLNVSERMLIWILYDNLHFHPYKILYTQQLLPANHPTSVAFSETMLQKIQSKEIPLDTIFITGEAHFYLNGDVNKQNLWYWSDKNPQIVRVKPLQSLKVTVKMQVAAWGIIGSYFLMAQIMANVTNSC